MNDLVRDAYDAMAERYAAVALGDLDRDTPDRAWLAEFARLAALGEGVVADFGCGPGYVTKYLSELGLMTLGFDISPALIAEAQRAFPDLDLQVGDLTALDVADSSLAGVVSRYSVMRRLSNSPKPSMSGSVFSNREPRPSCRSSLRTRPRHGSPFDHKVVTAYELCPATIVSELGSAGFDSIEVGTRRPLDGERPLDHGTILARRARRRIG